MELRVYPATGKQNRLKTELQSSRQRKLQFLKVEDSALSVEHSALQVSPSESPPVIACYCATFLKPEMLHIYRQITALKRCVPVVIAQKREQAGRYPFE
ncbi:MAG: hypothetical protein ACREFF_05755, partial [Candidatus Udaeobacter sp.]